MTHSNHIPPVETPAFLQRYRASFERTCSDDTPIDEVRFVALDSETTGLDPLPDRIITIGAVSVVSGEIHLGDSISELLKVEHNTSAVTVHGTWSVPLWRMRW